MYIYCMYVYLHCQSNVSAHVISNIFGLNHYDYKYERGVDGNRRGLRIFCDFDLVENYVCKCFLMITLIRLHSSRVGHTLFKWLLTIFTIFFYRQPQLLFFFLFYNFCLAFLRIIITCLLVVKR